MIFSRNAQRSGQIVYLETQTPLLCLRADGHTFCYVPVPEKVPIKVEEEWPRPVTLENVTYRPRNLTL